MEMTDIDFLIENQKNEIESEQAAYIWNELEAHLMKQANPVLEEVFQQRIVAIEFLVHEDERDQEVELARLLVSLENIANDENQIIEQIADINVQPIFKNETGNKQDGFDRSGIIETLQHLWELSSGEIEIIWEGGTS